MPSIPLLQGVNRSIRSSGHTYTSQQDPISKINKTINIFNMDIECFAKQLNWKTMRNAI
jgi:hypothetical protein